MAVTSQAAEKVYRALNEPARVTTRLKARESTRLGMASARNHSFSIVRVCIGRQRSNFFLDQSCLRWSGLCWDVPHMAEIVVGGSITDSWRVKKDERLIWADSFRITDETFAQLNRKALLSDCKAIATLIYFGPDLDKQLESLRESLLSLECDCVSNAGRRT